MRGVQVGGGDPTKWTTSDDFHLLMTVIKVGLNMWPQVCDRMPVAVRKSIRAVLNLDPDYDARPASAAATAPAPAAAQAATAPPAAALAGTAAGPADADRAGEPTGGAAPAAEAAAAKQNGDASAVATATGGGEAEAASSGPGAAAPAAANGTASGAEGGQAAQDQAAAAPAVPAGNTDGPGAASPPAGKNSAPAGGAAEATRDDAAATGGAAVVDTVARVNGAATAHSKQNDDGGPASTAGAASGGAATEAAAAAAEASDRESKEVARGQEQEAKFLELRFDHLLSLIVEEMCSLDPREIPYAGVCRAWGGPQLLPQRTLHPSASAWPRNSTATAAPLADPSWRCLACPASCTRRRDGQAAGCCVHHCAWRRTVRW